MNINANQRVTKTAGNKMRSTVDSHFITFFSVELGLLSYTKGYKNSRQLFTAFYNSFWRRIGIIFLSTSFKMCFGCSNEPSY